MSDFVSALLLIFFLIGPSFLWGRLVASYLNGLLAIFVTTIGLPFVFLTVPLAFVVLSTLLLEPEKVIENPVSFLSDASFAVFGLSAMMSMLVVPMVLFSMVAGFVGKREMQKISDGISPKPEGPK